MKALTIKQEAIARTRRLDTLTPREFATSFESNMMPYAKHAIRRVATSTEAQLLREVEIHTDMLINTTDFTFTNAINNFNKLTIHLYSYAISQGALQS